ncbi:MAG: 30S ribosomal protein S20 [Verrucomicrobiota bacterium]
MANNAAALKRVRQIEKRTLSNRVVKSRVKSLRKKVEEAVSAGDRAAVDTAISEYSSAVDRAVKNSIFHKNKGANLKSKAVSFAKAAAKS